MTEIKALPKAIKEGVVKIGNCELLVCVLDDGRRIIEEKSFISFLEALNSGSLGEFTDDDAIKLAKAINEWHSLGYTKEGVKPKEIIGKPITLSQVLLALNDNLFVEGDICEYLVTNDGLIMTTSHIPWDIRKETLEEQSEETQRAVWELLNRNEYC